MKHNILVIVLLLALLPLQNGWAQRSNSVQTTFKQPANTFQMPTPTIEAKPGLRWWWLGSAVDEQNLSWSLSEYAKAGVGAVEITPIYGVQNNEKNDISYLSPRWMQMLRYVEQQADSLGILVDMATGTGWPFGGPWVSLSDAACKAVFVDTTVSVRTNPLTINFNVPEKERPYSRFKLARSFPVKGRPDLQRVIALYEGRTRMKVKRAAPGGEGYVIDHFDSLAVARYLAHIDSAFTASGTPFPHSFFNDSYEEHRADWTPTLLEEFFKLKGYRLEDRLDALVNRDTTVVSHYRETLGHLLLNNFTRQWTNWAHRHGATTRNQAHGSPANLIDCYAAVDIPEIEGFGLTDFGIRGLRTDSGMTRPNYSDLSMLKYAPSAAHITGKKLTSSETFTWLTEHFRTSLSQMKPDLDLMFCAGVNRVFFHGTAYSPKDAAWPGWKFYASIDMSPTNSIWRDAPELMRYITRCQTFLQWGEPDNDFLVYLPVRDMWKRNTEKLLMQFDIHSMGKKAPEFINTVLGIERAGFDCDYISDQFLMQTRMDGGLLTTCSGAKYKALIVADDATMPDSLRQYINQLRQQGARIIPSADRELMEQAAKPEQSKVLGLSMIRRRNPWGHHYFIANLTPTDIESLVPMAVKDSFGLWIDPMTMKQYRAEITADGTLIRLRSGESRILLTSNLPFDKSLTDSLPLQSRQREGGKQLVLDHNRWTLSFIEEQPRVKETFRMDSINTWEALSDSAACTMGTGVYETTFRLSAAESCKQWQLELGDVRESARVYLNGHYVGCAWAAPFVLDCNGFLRKGRNALRIEVTNLPANRIADMDRRGVEWRRMKDINVVDINYKKTRYDGWKPVKSGLAGGIRLVEME